MMIMTVRDGLGAQDAQDAQDALEARDALDARRERSCQAGTQQLKLAAAITTEVTTGTVRKEILLDR